MTELALFVLAMLTSSIGYRAYRLELRVRELERHPHNHGSTDPHTP